MDLLIVALLVLVVIVMAVRGRARRRSGPTPRSSTRGRWSFSRHPKEDWRYWRDLAILLSVTLALLLTMIALANLGRS